MTLTSYNTIQPAKTVGVLFKKITWNYLSAKSPPVGLEELG